MVILYENMRGDGIQPDTATISLIISAYADLKSNVDDIIKLYHSLKERQEKPTLAILQVICIPYFIYKQNLLLPLALNKKNEVIEEIVEDLKQGNFPLDINYFNALMYSCWFTKKFDDCWNTWDTVKKKKIRPNALVRVEEYFI
jgi:hypothetical protein